MQIISLVAIFPHTCAENVNALFVQNALPGAGRITSTGDKGLAMSQRDLHERIRPLSMGVVSQKTPAQNNVAENQRVKQLEISLTQSSTERRSNRSLATRQSRDVFLIHHIKSAALLAIGRPFTLSDVLSSTGTPLRLLKRASKS
jgi:hypothetical protein